MTRFNTSNSTLQAQTVIPTYPIADDGRGRANEPHSRIHQGVFFSVDYVTPGADVTNNGHLDIVVTTVDTPMGYPHIVARPTLGGSCDFLIYRAPTFSGGTAITARNHKDYSTRAAPGAFVHSPTVTAVGTLLQHLHLPGGIGGQAVGVGAANRDDEWLLNRNTSYLFRITNVSGQARRGGLSLSIYQSPAIDDA